MTCCWLAGEHYLRRWLSKSSLDTTIVLTMETITTSCYLLTDMMLLMLSRRSRYMSFFSPFFCSCSTSRVRRAAPTVRHGDLPYMTCPLACLPACLPHVMSCPICNERPSPRTTTTTTTGPIVISVSSRHKTKNKNCVCHNLPGDR